MIKLNIGDDGTSIELTDNGYISINDEPISQRFIDQNSNYIWNEEKQKSEVIPKYNVEELKKEGKILQIKVGEEPLPFEDNSVDVIVSYSCIGRGYVTDYTEIVRVLKPNGEVYLYCSYLEELPKLMVYFDEATINTQNFNFEDPDDEYNDYCFLLKYPIKENNPAVIYDIPLPPL